jgi:chemotaxis protein MotB
VSGHGGDDGLPEEHEEHANHEAWVIPYADLLTLLMAMFIALFAMSTVDQSKFKQLAIGFNEALGGGDLDAGIGGEGKHTADATVGNGQGKGPFDGGDMLDTSSSESQAELSSVLAAVAADKAAVKEERQSLEDVKKNIDDAAKTLGLGGSLQTQQLEGGLQITLLTDRVVFESGQADVQEGGRRLLNLVAGVLKQLPNKIRINGHTDSVPLRGGARYPDNLELSSARANAVFRLLELLGVDRKRMSPAGMGDKEPIGDNRTDAGKAKNRRVEIIVESEVKDQILNRSELSDNPLAEHETTPTTKPIEDIGSGIGGAKPTIEPDLGVGGHDG